MTFSLLLFDQRLQPLMRLVMAGCGIACAAPAGAQSIAEADARQVSLRASISADYDSNILRGQAVELSRPDAARADVVFEPRVTADIVAPFGRQSIFLNGTLGYRFHARNAFLDREAINLTAGARLRPVRLCRATLAATYVRQQSALFNIFDTLDPENTETIVAGSADLACATAGGLTGSVGHKRSRATNSALLRQVNEYESHVTSVALGMARPRLGVVSVYGRYAVTDYPNRPPLAPGLSVDGVKVYATGLRYERQIGTRLTGEVSAGYTKVDPQLPGVRPFKGASWSADLSYDSRNRLRARLAAERAVEQSNLIGESYGITTAYRASVDYALNDRLVLTGGVAHVRRRFEQSPLLQLPKFNSRDRTNTVYARLTAGKVGPVALAFDLAREQRKAAERLYSYGSTRVGVTATARFGH